LHKVSSSDVFGVSEEVQNDNAENLPRSRTPATRTSTFLGSLDFAAGLLGFGVDQSVLGKPRVRIAVYRTPFTNDVVKKLKTHSIQGSANTSCVLAAFVVLVNLSAKKSC